MTRAHLRRAWLAYTLLSIAVGITMSWLIAIAFAGRGVETALAAYCWGFGYCCVTPWALRAVGRWVGYNERGGSSAKPNRLPDPARSPARPRRAGRSDSRRV